MDIQMRPFVRQIMASGVLSDIRTADTRVRRSFKAKQRGGELCKGVAYPDTFIPSAARLIAGRRADACSTLIDLLTH